MDAAFIAKLASGSWYTLSSKTRMVMAKVLKLRFHIKLCHLWWVDSSEKKQGNQPTYPHSATSPWVIPNMSLAVSLALGYLNTYSYSDILAKDKK